MPSISTHKALAYGVHDQESKRKCEMEKFVRPLVLIDIRYRHVESGFLQLPCVQSLHNTTVPKFH